MISFWGSLLRGLFFFSKSEQEVQGEEKRENVIEPDFIDYDGMGNQGRFVNVNKTRKRKNKK